MMFGTNRRRGLEFRGDATLQVHEVFYTIQGEGPFVGRPAVFVRLTGCNLGCTFCDTVWNDDNDPYMTSEEIKQIVLDSFPSGVVERPVVVITGGEPTRQVCLEDLVKVLSDFDVQIETNGMFDVSRLVRAGAHIVCSPKTNTVHKSVQKHCKHFKYVVRAAACASDGLPSFQTQSKTHKDRPWNGAIGLEGVTIYLQPMDEQSEELNRLNREYAVEVCQEKGFRLCLQTHKILGLR